MCIAFNKKWEKTSNGRSRTAKSRKYKNAWRKESYKYEEILEADTIKQAWVKKK